MACRRERILRGSERVSESDLHRDSHGRHRFAGFPAQGVSSVRGEKRSSLSGGRAGQEHACCWQVEWGRHSGGALPVRWSAEREEEA